MTLDSSALIAILFARSWKPVWAAKTARDTLLFVGEDFSKTAIIPA